ncbi:MarR family winged helix-turn-helix transcriptional regulator [Parachitinimonas caeni]|uniref:MarR family transcriptional regulator n=1 Tax=Parachitinimonas caeni TaxID=3031301 RepID=A0ABT7E2Z0_9NEIS|nr:MarR family transcriptional regulator [Parachitinimonas caeni]MDK2126679.1 MarR family transcriptional regulator [Parachitinimonas caeni]
MLSKYEALLGQTAHFPSINPSRVRLIVDLVNAVSRITQQCAANLSDFQLPEGQFVTLLLLRHFGQLKPSELADKAGLTRSGITTVLDGLEARQLIRRHHQQDDRRSWHIEMTESGNQILDEVLPLHLEWLARLTAKFDESDSEQLESLIRKLSAD